MSIVDIRTREEGAKLEPTPVRLQVVPEVAHSNRSRTQLPAAVVLISPNEVQRRKLRRIIETRHSRVAAEVAHYPNYNHLLTILDVECDAFLIDVDTNNDTALDLVETICSRKPATTVMVYSERSKPDLVLRSMRAGAREFLTVETTPNEFADALTSAVVRHAEQAAKKTRGKVLVFWGAKGGSGVTTVAANLAIALRAETGEGVALVDLNPQLGDVAVLLGITPRFTIADALLDPERMDEEFVSNLATPHSSGVSVIAAPDEYRTSIMVDARTVGKFVDTVRGCFPYVVIDAGLGLGSAAASLFQIANTIYLVAQGDLASLRNSQRFISHLQEYGAPSIELVLNRFDRRKSEFDDKRLTKALGVPPKWKIPDDHASARRASNAGTPLLASGSPVGKILRQMARAACGKPEEESKKGFRFFK
ncbi:MAG: AAA family ATPase [Acidobacteriota bacterium]|jgi:pilus assembly protein CpaE